MIAATPQLCLVSATELRSGYLAGRFTPEEAMRAVLARIAAVNGSREQGINAFTEILYDEAMRRARTATDIVTAARRTGDPIPALLGIPVATKEKHAIGGRTLELGLLSRRGRMAVRDHPVVARIRAAGGIVHARTTTPEFSCATVTHSPLWGVTRNPWNLRASPGGSSGGAGAALAAGMATLATASDIAGSTRVPAGFTGTVGYKAPYGRIPGTPPLSADTYRGDGPMARTVADTALLADVMSGHDRGDHFSWGAPGDLSAALEQCGSSLTGVRVGLATGMRDVPVHPEVRAATERVGQALRERGARVEEVELPWSSERIREVTFAHFGHLLGPALAAEAVGPGGRRPQVAAYTSRFIEDAAEAARAMSHYECVRAEARIQAELAAVMEPVDALVCPVSAVTSLTADGDYLDGIDAPGEQSIHLRHYWQAHLTSAFNVCNRCPVLAVPAGMAGDGTPIGVQLVGKPLDELLPFRLGAAVEAESSRPAWPRLDV
ncbi:amidase [Tsukamurella serpentis]